MLSTFRLRSAAALLAAALLVTACGEETPLPTTIDPVATQADIDAAEAALEVPEVESLAGLGYAIDDAMIAAGGGAAVATLPAQVIEEGPVPVHSLDRFRARVIDMSGGETANTIPLLVLGKTFVWNPETDEYEIDADLTGAPANGVRFRLYEVDEFGLPVEPLVWVGYVDMSRTTEGNSTIGNVGLFTAAGVQVMDYTVTVTGTASVTTFSVDGFVGAGAGQLTFELTTGVSLTTGNVTLTWRTAIPSRGLSTRVQLAIGETSVTIGALMRSGLRKVEIGGTLSDASGGTLNVEVGDRLFAVITLDELGTGTIEDENGAPLTAEDEAALWAIFEWFESAFLVPDILLAPLFTILDL
jgi:hypothetical protein